MPVGFRTKLFLLSFGAAVIAVSAYAFRQSVLEATVAAALAAAGSGWIGWRLVDIGLAKASTERDGGLENLQGRLSELATDRARMAAILSGMVEGVLVVDADGRLRLINDAAREMLHLEDIQLGRHYVEVVRQPGIVRELGAALNGEARHPIEVPLDAGSSARGGPRIFRAQTTPASDRSGAVLVLHDVSDLRRVERVRRDFVANVSHELRTPLTAIRGYVEALREGPHSAAQQEKFLGVIHRHTGRMERLVRDLLQLARLDAHQDTADLRSTDVAELFRSVATDLSERIERQQLRLEVNIDPAASVVKADAGKLQDALRNLVENAVNHSAAGGSVELGARIEKGSVALSVGDRGPGVPESDLGRVFERFYRVDKSRSSDAGGTGLGLSIVRHLVELHGGRVRAENRPEGGALFTILLPR